MTGLVSLYIRECDNTLYVELQHAVPPTDTKFKPLLLQTQAGVPYINTHKHRTSYLKSTLTFVGPAKCWKSNSTDRQKREILAFLHHQYNNNSNNFKMYQHWLYLSYRNSNIFSPKMILVYITHLQTQVVLNLAHDIQFALLCTV